jgi:hypothetical protein
MQKVLQMLQILDARENMFNFQIWDNFTSLLEEFNDFNSSKAFGHFSRSIK